MFRFSYHAGQNSRVCGGELGGGRVGRGLPNLGKGRRRGRGEESGGGEVPCMFSCIFRLLSFSLLPFFIFFFFSFFLSFPIEFFLLFFHYHYFVFFFFRLSFISPFLHFPDCYFHFIYFFLVDDPSPLLEQSNFIYSVCCDRWHFLAHVAPGPPLARSCCSYS